MEIDLEKLEESKKENFRERLEFVEFWAEYIKTHGDEEWSKQQNLLINSQIENVRALVKDKEGITIGF